MVLATVLPEGTREGVSCAGGGEEGEGGLKRKHHYWHSRRAKRASQRNFARWEREYARRMAEWTQHTIDWMSTFVWAVPDKVVMENEP